MMHGLRNTAASELAESRAGVNGIMAVTGHKTPHMALYYCKLADQGRINKNAADGWDEALEHKAKAKAKAKP